MLKQPEKPEKGFTHHGGLTRTGTGMVKRKTAKDRFGRSLKSIAQWSEACRGGTTLGGTPTPGWAPQHRGMHACRTLYVFWA